MRTLVSERRIHLAVATLVAAALVALMVLLAPPSMGATTGTMKTCQDNHPICAVYPKGSWKQVKSSKASGGTYHVGRSATRPAVFRPSVGPEIDLVTATGPKAGSAKVTVYDLCDRNAPNDVVKVVKFNLKTERPHHKVVKKIRGLRQDRMYAVAVVSANGKPVTVDAFRGTLVPAADHSGHHPGSM